MSGRERPSGDTPRPRPKRSLAGLLAVGAGAAAAVALLRRSTRWAAIRASLRTSSAPSAASYEGIFDRILRSFFERVAADLAGAMSDRSSPRILEIGPGPGALAVLIAETMPAATIVGVDIDEAMVLRASDRAERAGVRDRVRLLVGDASALPFADATFDAAVSTFSVHHWTDAPRGFAEVRRVLRPGGRALIYDLPDRWGRFEARARPLADAALAGGWTCATADVVPWPWRRLSIVRRLDLVRRGEGA